MSLYVYTFYKLLAFRAIIFYNSFLNHCLVLLDKVWIKIKNQNLDGVFNHRMCRLYVKCDEVDQQITERSWYVFHTYVGVAVLSKLSELPQCYF